MFGGGYTTTQVNVIDYVTIATTGNATSFGQLTQSRLGLGSCSSSTRAVFGGGSAGSTYYNIIDYITIATTGNAIDFSKTDEFQFRSGLHRELVKLRKVALRLGRLGERTADWVIKHVPTKKLLAGKKTLAQLTELDVKYDVRQKGVDMRVGLDIASMVFKRQVDRPLRAGCPRPRHPLVRCRRLRDEARAPDSGERRRPARDRARGPLHIPATPSSARARCRAWRRVCTGPATARSSCLRHVRLGQSRRGRLHRRRAAA